MSHSSDGDVQSASGDTPEDARRQAVHDAWRCWRDADSSAPATRPVVATVAGSGPAPKNALREWPAEAVRWALLATHPGESLQWDEVLLQQSLIDLSRLYEARETARELQGEEPAPKVAHALGSPAWEVIEHAQSLRRNVSSALADGFDSATALSHLSALATALNRFANHKQARRRGAPVVRGALEALAKTAEPLGFLLDDVDRFRGAIARKRLPARGLSPAQVEQWVADRAAARGARDWAEADAIRARLDEAGIIVIDGDAGSTWRVRP